MARCRPSLPPSQLPKGQEHLVAGLAPGGVNSGGASFRQAQTLLWCEAHQSRLQGWLVLGGEPATSPPPPQTFLCNGIFFPVHLLPTHRAPPSPVCRSRPHRPCLFLRKGVPQRRPGGEPDPNSRWCVTPCSSTPVCSRSQISCVHTCENTTLINIMLTDEKTRAQRG